MSEGQASKGRTPRPKPDPKLQELSDNVEILTAQVTKLTKLVSNKLTEDPPAKEGSGFDLDKIFVYGEKFIGLIGSLQAVQGGAIAGAGQLAHSPAQAQSGEYSPEEMHLYMMRLDPEWPTVLNRLITLKVESPDVYASAKAMLLNG